MGGGGAVMVTVTTKMVLVRMREAISNDLLGSGLQTEYKGFTSEQHP